MYAVTLNGKGTFEWGSKLDVAWPKGGQDDLDEMEEVANGDHHTLLHKDTGLFWTVSMANGRVREGGRIYSGVTDALLREGRVRKVVLQACGEHGGTLLISARREASVLADAKKDALPEPPGTPQGGSLEDHARQAKVQAERERLERDQDPFLVWFRLDPASGTVRRLVPAPEGAKEVLEPEDDGAWTPLKQGGVRMGPLRVKRDPGKAVRLNPGLQDMK